MHWFCEYDSLLTQGERNENIAPYQSNFKETSSLYKATSKCNRKINCLFCGMPIWPIALQKFGKG